MAALTRAEQGNHPASAPNSSRQRGHGRGQMDRSIPGYPSSHNGQSGLGQTSSVCSASVGHGTGTTTTGSQGPNTQGSKEGTSNRKDPSSLQCFRCQGWGHMAWECTIPAKTLNPLGEPRECGTTPHWHQPQQPAVDPQHSLPDPEPKLTTIKAAQMKGQPEVTSVPFLNPDPIAYLVGCSNEAPVIVDGQEMTAGLHHKLPVLWGCHTADPAPGSVIGTKGDRGFHHPIPQICGGQPSDPRGHKLQWGCAVAGHTNHDLFWDGPSYGWIQNHR